MADKQLKGRFVLTLFLIIVPIILLLVYAGASLSEFMAAREPMEVLTSPEADAKLKSLLSEHWKLPLDPLMAEVHGAIQHPRGLALGEWGNTGWFSAKSAKPDVIVQSLISMAKQDIHTKEFEGLAPGTLDHAMPKDIPGWWNPGSPPQDLQVFEVFNSDPLWLGYSKGLNTVYFKVMW